MKKECDCGNEATEKKDDIFLCEICAEHHQDAKDYESGTCQNWDL